MDEQTAQSADQPATGYRRVQVDGKFYDVPDTATSEQISGYLKAIPAANAPHAPKARTWTDVAAGVTAGGILGGARALPTIQKIAEEVATNPNVPRVSASIGRVIGGVAPIVGGAYEGGPIGALAGVAAASKGAWAGGKTGWFTGKLLQNVAAPVANAAETLAPYAKMLTPLSIAQGVGALAQIADPNRKDTAIFGTEPDRSDAEKAAHPALVNLAITKVSDAIKYLMSQGLSQGEAVRTIMNQKVKGGQ